MAANHGVLIGWNRIVPGMETQGQALFGEAMAFWARQQQAGAIDSFEPIFLAPHGGDLNGFILVRGDAAQLSQLMTSDEYLALEIKANTLLSGHGVIQASFGEEIARRMGIFQKVTSSL